MNKKFTIKDLEDRNKWKEIAEVMAVNLKMVQHQWFTALINELKYLNSRETKHKFLLKHTEFKGKPIACITAFQSLTASGFITNEFDLDPELARDFVDELHIKMAGKEINEVFPYSERYFKAPDNESLFFRFSKDVMSYISDKDVDLPVTILIQMAGLDKARALISQQTVAFILSDDTKYNKLAQQISSLGKDEKIQKNNPVVKKNDSPTQINKSFTKNKIANWALGFGIASVFFASIGIVPLVAVTLSVIALYKSKEYSGDGKNKAIAGLILGIIYTIVYLYQYGHIQ